jgi:8-oxo-dGTP pyrophosphatase MutT (NUDIX family)
LRARAASAILDGVSRAFPPLAVLEASLREIPPPELAGAELEAAVLVCLHEESILLVQRQHREGDRWSGQVALPGGRHDPGDASLLQTAVRETEEEVGFDPEAHGRILGSAGTWLATGPWPGAVRIAIYVAALGVRPPISLSDELTDAYWVAVDSLVPTVAPVPEKPEPVPAYVVAALDRELVVWGITFRILEHLRALGAP